MAFLVKNSAFQLIEMLALVIDLTNDTFHPINYVLPIDFKEPVEWSHRNLKETQRIQIINTDKSEAEGNKDQWVEQVALKTQLEEVNLEDDQF